MLLEKSHLLHFNSDDTLNLQAIEKKKSFEPLRKKKTKDFRTLLSVNRPYWASYATLFTTVHMSSLYPCMVVVTYHQCCIKSQHIKCRCQNMWWSVTPRSACLIWHDGCDWYHVRLIIAPYWLYDKEPRARLPDISTPAIKKDSNALQKKVSNRVMDNLLHVSAFVGCQLASVKNQDRGHSGNGKRKTFRRQSGLTGRNPPRTD